MIMGVSFFDTMAFFADEKFRKVAMGSITMIMCMVMNMVVITRDKGIQSLNAVDKAVTRQKLQSPVNRWCLGLPTSGCKRSKIS